MENDEDGMNMAANNGDYGNEDYDGAGDNNGNADGNVDGNDNNNNGGGNEGEVDQYFDDAGDIGYLPADHVTSPSSL